MLLLHCCGTTGETLAEPLLRRCNWTTFFGLPRPLAASPRPLLTSFGRGWHRSSLGDALIFVSKFWVGIAFGATKECVDRRVAPPDINDPHRWPTSQWSWLSAGTARRWWWGFASQSLYCTISLKAVCSSKLYNRRSLGILLNDFQLCQLLYFFIISVCLCVFRSWHRQCPDIPAKIWAAGRHEGFSGKGSVCSLLFIQGWCWMWWIQTDYCWIH